MKYQRFHFIFGLENGFLKNDYVFFMCRIGTGANPLLENDSGHRPLAYVKSQQIKELLQDSEQKVWFDVSVYLTSQLLIATCKYFSW